MEPGEARGKPSGQRSASREMEGGKWEEESYEFTLAGGGTLRTDSNHDDGE